MDETATRRKKIDPKLYGVGWEQVPESEILTEQRAYQIAPGQVSALPQNRHPKKADYILEYKKKKLAVIEAKSDEKDVSVGIPQAKEYAELLHIRFAYATNGNEIWGIDMGVKDAAGNYLLPSKEGPVNQFPSPQELWAMTYTEHNEWRDKFNLCAMNRGGGREPRYYQEIAVDAVLTAIANGQKRILLTMATGTGKTYTAFQICWKLYETNWNMRGKDQKPRILFISDRNILANQAKNDFEQFPEDAMERVTPELIHDKKHNNRLPTARHLYFTIFQTVMGSAVEGGEPYYKQWPRDFFDFIIIDECHRGGANDESEWRELMNWFEPAVQLGMTATPRRKVNANTYEYFGAPVYTYSLKQGIEDGFLTPYRVQVATSNIDTYQYNPNDDVEGDIDKEKVYTEKDFYNGDIRLKERDEHRVKELLAKIDPNEKTLVFCCTQQHAYQIMAMINQWKRVPDSNYCERVTADDGANGEKTLKLFQNNDLLRPTILTTSQKLSTGVDARNVRNIVLLRPVNNMVEFKQILGRGTRLFDGKYFFTLYDFVGASKNFNDPEWDGDPFCPVCGNYPCTCHKKPKGVCPKCGQDPCVCPPPQPCPVCGHLPCTCNGTGKKKQVVVKLSPLRSLMLHTDWDERIQFADELLTIEEYVKKLFGTLPDFLDGEEDLRQRWSRPDTRQQLLDVLERSGFQEDKLELMGRFLQMEKCDMLDVLAYLAYNTTPMERERRAEILRKDMMRKTTKQQLEFADFILSMYVRNGFKELGMDKLPTLIDMKYHSTTDALARLQMTPPEMRDFFLTMQKDLYDGPAVSHVYKHYHPVKMYSYNDGDVRSVAAEE
ncbi:MAG: DEAD/DEAH box helicase family protein [Bacteroidaceae bacterium]|nr:DEAD/DEAH box helicase family protein [Bacteroidaceae bacterium]